MLATSRRRRQPPARLTAAAVFFLAARGALSQCPGGSLDACIDLCPGADPVVYQSCVRHCGDVCPHGPAPPPPPAPPAVRYHCDAGAGACVHAAAGHSTAAKCEAACRATPPPAPPAPAAVVGYWDTTWQPARAPAGVTLGVAFGGWADATKALSDATAVRGSLRGEKWVDLGGGNKNGRFDAAGLRRAESMIRGGDFSGWAGLVLDVEECAAAGLAPAFAAALRAAKAGGMRTMVTVSHSAPYGCTDAAALMKGFLASADVDYLSPQLYTGGEESAPDFSPTDGAGVPWRAWRGARPLFVPSLPSNALARGGYAAAQAYFKKLGIACAGYIEWPSGS